MLKRPFRVRRSRAGVGLFATKPFKKGAFVVAYRGRRIPDAEAAKREARGARYIFEINSRWAIDGSSRRNIARYVNHSCRPNVEAAVRKHRIAYVARRSIKPDEEITVDYGKEYFDGFIKQKGCRCIKCAETRRKKDALGRSSVHGNRTARNSPTHVRHQPFFICQSPSIPPAGSVMSAPNQPIPGTSVASFITIPPSDVALVLAALRLSTSNMTNPHRGRAWGWDFYDAAAGALAHSDQRVFHILRRHLFKLPVEQLAVERFHLAGIGRHHSICTNGLPMTPPV